MEITPSVTMVSTTPPAPAAVETAVSKPGKSGMAVGQVAKQAVAAARSAVIDLPANAQGLAASQIARGADPASIFAAQVEEPTGDPVSDVDGETVPADGEVLTTGDNGDAIVTPVAEETTTEPAESFVDGPAEQYQTSLMLLETAADASAQTALDLLS